MSADRERHFDTSHLQADLGRRTARGAAVIMGAHGVRFVLETARIIVLARLLQPADYGLVAMATVVTGFIDRFRDLGLNMATVTRQELNHAQVSTLFWVNLGVGLALALVAASLAPLLAWFYGEDRLIAITCVLASSFVLAGLTVQHQALLRRQMRFGALSAIRILSVTVGLVAGIFAAYRGAGYWALVAMTLASSATNAVAVWVASGWRPGLPVRGVGTLEMVRFGGQVTGTNLLGYLSRRLDHLLIGWWWGAVPLGLYTKAYSLVRAPTSRALTPVGSVIIPSLSRLVGQPERYRDAYLRVLEKLALVMMPGAVFLIATASWLVPFVLGSQWTEAAPIFGVVAVTAFVAPVEGSNWWLFVTQDRADEALRLGVMVALITALAVVIGLPWGGVGVAAAIAGASVLRVPLIVWYVTRRGPVRAGDIYRTLAPHALASVAALLVLAALAPRAEGLQPAVVIGAAALVTAGVALATLGLVPGGRRALVDAWASLQLLRRRAT